MALVKIIFRRKFKTRHINIFSTSLLFLRAGDSLPVQHAICGKNVKFAGKFEPFLTHMARHTLATTPMMSFPL